MQRLGVFDSGIGGFNVVSELRKYTNLDIVFLADHKNLPYGNKSEELLKAILITNMQWFLDKDIKDVLIACNTASTYIDFLREKFPDINIYSIIEITANQFTEAKKLLIFGTDRTVSSKIYNRHLKKAANYKALSDLAGLVEYNDKNIIKEYLVRELSSVDLDQDFLLACTHYSIVKEIFEEILQKEVYDSLAPTIEFFKDFTGDKKLTVYTSANIKVLKTQLLEIFNYDLDVFPKDDEFKIVVVSDNHGRHRPITKVLSDNKDAAAFIHCGDVELDPQLVSDFYVVNGNNDFYYTYPDNLIVQVGRLKLYITHGDEHPRHNRRKKIYKDGALLNADIICYGHEHIYQETVINDTLLINPGSLFYNRDQTPNSYAIISVNKTGYTVKRVNIEGDIL
ncbi:MAG: YfcE family phosphodiesterase [Erysipelothrix sp.]|nr:YfcE family phosphodiesterase [Erysipelothrix sp.]